jgi:hypothetical protein
MAKKITRDVRWGRKKTTAPGSRPFHVFFLKWVGAEMKEVNVLEPNEKRSDDVIFFFWKLCGALKSRSFILKFFIFLNKQNFLMENIFLIKRFKKNVDDGRWWFVKWFTSSPQHGSRRTWMNEFQPKQINKCLPITQREKLPRENYKKRWN